MTAPGAIRSVDTGPHATARVMLATMRQDRPTVRSVAEETGYGVSTVHRALLALSAEGLVSWEPGRKGTLRATCERPAWGPWHEPVPLRCLSLAVFGDRSKIS